MASSAVSAKQEIFMTSTDPYFGAGERGVQYLRFIRELVNNQARLLSEPSEL